MAWDPTDYILERKYCDLETISQALLQVRAGYEAEATVLIAWHRQRFFRSLAICSHRDPQREQKLREFLPRLTLHLEEQHATDAGAIVREGTISALADALLSRTRAPQLTEFHAQLSQLLNYLPGESRVLPLFPPTPNSDSVASAVVFVVNPAKRLPAGEAAQLLRSVHCMVNAYASVAIYRDHTHRHAADTEVMAKAAELMSKAYSMDPDLESRAPSIVPVTELADHLLSLAITYTRSDYGRWYIPTRDRAGLHLLAWSPNLLVGDQDRLVPCDANPVGKRSVVAYVAVRKQPFVLNTFDSLGSRYPHLEHVPVRTADGVAPAAQLVWPIIMAGSPDAPLLAVVDLQSASRKYTWGELDVLEQIVSAYRDLVREMLSGVTANFLHDVTKRTLYDRVRVHPPPRPPDGGVLVPATPADESRIPLGVLRVKSLIEYELWGLHDLTTSCYTGLRVLASNSKHLVRFCSYLAGEELRPLSIAVDDPRSVTAWVLREGRPCDVPDYSDKDWMKPYPGLQDGYVIRDQCMSSYTAPVSVLGRVVGTLHLESVYKNAYARCGALIVAVADAVATSIWCGRRELEGDTLSRRAWKAGVIHEVRKLVPKLGAEVSKYKQATPGLYRDLSDLTQGLEAACGLFDQAPAPPEPTIEKMIRAVIHNLRIGLMCEVHLNGLAQVTCASDRARDLRLALVELLNNAWKADAAKSQITLGVSRRRLGGVDYLCIAITNRFQRMTPDLERQLFRQPIARGAADTIDNLRYGALSTGTIVRNFGGDVYVAEVDYRARRVRVCVEVPMSGSDSI